MTPVKIIVSHPQSSVVGTIKKLTIGDSWTVITSATTKTLHTALLDEREVAIAVLDRATCRSDFSLIEAARKANPYIRIILIIKSWDLKEIRKAMNKGIFDFLMEPLEGPALSAAITKAMDQVKNDMIMRRMKKELQLVNKELEIATSIQKNILPTDTNQIMACEIYARMIPARQIGGDFYDYFVIDRWRIGFVIGDVSGKGIPAALLMAVCRSLVKATALQGWSPEMCLSHVNRVLSEDNPDAMFVTLFYGILDNRKKRMDYCIAGHDSPFVLRAGGEVLLLDRTGDMALGFDTSVTYKSKSLYLKKGDAVFFYTDGITEAENPAHQCYGRDRLLNLLSLLNGESAERMIEKILKEVRLFSLGIQQSDDITAMALRI